MNSNHLNNSNNTKKNLEGRYCQMPFTSVELHLNQNAYVCCPSWLKKSIGAFSKDNIMEIWNSESAREIRESIIDGSFRYCDHELCPYIGDNSLPRLHQLDKDVKDNILSKNTILNKPPKSVMFTYDASCNLSCPSCRSEKISLNADSPKYKELNELSHAITNKLLEDPHAHVRINITGSGDPFASLAFRHYLEKIDGSQYPNLRFDLQTNGLLLTPLMWERMSKIQANIGEICVSIDAINPETYAAVRRGGKLEILMENMKYLASLRRQNKFAHLQANFVIQTKNYKEIPEFARVFIEMGCDSVYFSRILDWGSYPKETFFDQCVWEEKHPEFDHFISVLNHPILSHHKIAKGNITPFIQLAAARNRASMSKLEIWTSSVIFFLNRKTINLIKKIKKFLNIQHPNKK